MDLKGVSQIRGYAPGRFLLVALQLCDVRSRDLSRLGEVRLGHRPLHTVSSLFTYLPESFAVNGDGLDVSHEFFLVAW